MADQFDWYRTALTSPHKIGSAEIPVHDGIVHSGYYRMRKFKDGPWQAVGIWALPDRFVRVVNGQEVDEHWTQEKWTFFCRNPISFEDFEAAQSSGWVFADDPITAPDERQPDDVDFGAANSTHPATVGVGHNSGDLAPFQESEEEVLRLAATAERLLKSAITTQGDADKASAWAVSLGKAGTKADERRKVEKQPHLDACRAVDAMWNPIIDRADDLSKKLKKHQEDFLKAKKAAEEKRAREEAEKAAALRREAEARERREREARLAAEREAARKEAEAQAAADAEEWERGRPERERIAAEKAEREAIERQRQEEQRAVILRQADDAERASKVRNASAGSTGSKVKLVKRTRAKVTDMIALLTFLKDDADVVAAATKRANAAIKAKLEPLPGTVKEEYEEAA